jgi:hypothetical protein
VGSAIGAMVWPAFGWIGVSIAGLVFTGLGAWNHLRKASQSVATS